MARGLQNIATRTMWALALFVALAAARYFLVPPPFLVSPILPAALKTGPEAAAIVGLAPHLYADHRVWLLLHIAGGIVAITSGLFQFVGSLRASRPKLHRATGYLYLTAVLIGGIAGIPLSIQAMDNLPLVIRSRFYPMVAGVVGLALAWIVTALAAVYRARQHRFSDHRAWMIRSYSLTFSAVSVRLVGPVLLFATGDPVLAINGAFLSWPLNLMVAQWLITRSAVDRAPKFQSAAV